MQATLDDLYLAVSDDEELLAVLTFLDEIVAQLDLLRHEAARKPRHNSLVNSREQGDAAQILCAERGDPVKIADADAFCLTKLHLSAVDTIGPALHLYPRQEFQKKPRGDRPHLGGGLGSVG